MMMFLRFLFALTLLAVSDVAAYATEPWAIATASSVVEARSALRHIYQRLGRKDLVAALDSAAVTDLVSGNLRGLSLHKPLGCMVLPNAQGTGSVLTFVPISTADEFRGFLQRHGLTVENQAENLSIVRIPILGTVYLRFVDQYAWFALKADDLNQPLPDPEKTIPAIHRKMVLASTIYLERLPADERRVWVQRGQQGLHWLLNRSTSIGSLGEAITLPVMGVLMHHLAEDARELTLLASVDKGKDLLWAEAIVQPRANGSWKSKLQTLDSKKLDVSGKTWAALRGKPPEVAQKAAEAAFTAPDQDQIHLSMSGGDTLHLRAEMSGAMLAYHAALNKDPSAPDRHERHRQRKEERRSQRQSIPPG
jgi:hypothetical protein